MARRVIALVKAAPSYWLTGFASVGILLIAAGAQYATGRRLWGISGEPGLWSGKVLSPHNSQFVADPYTFTHVTHGILWYGVFWLAFRQRSLRARFLFTVGAESIWEVIENTDFVMQRYRAATISLDYYGDSIVNSISDTLFMVTGFLVARVLPVTATALIGVAFEVMMALHIRDNLTLNVLMLIYPLEAVKQWQSGPPII